MKKQALVLKSIFICVSALTITSKPFAQSTFIDTLNRGNEVTIGDAQSRNSARVVANEKQTTPKFDTEISDTKRPMIDGFRVQCMATSQKEKAQKEQKLLTEKLKLPVYIMFVAPYYKVYAGDFTQRAKAEDIQEHLKKNGYPDAWIASQRVFLNQ